MQRRKDNKGRVLKDGEVYRKSDGLYMYRWTAKNGKRHTIYDATLEGLREKEEKIQHDLAEGIRIPIFYTASDRECLVQIFVQLTAFDQPFGSVPKDELAFIAIGH